MDRSRQGEVVVTEEERKLIEVIAGGVTRIDNRDRRVEFVQGKSAAETLKLLRAAQTREGGIVFLSPRYRHR